MSCWWGWGRRSLLLLVASFVTWFCAAEPARAAQTIRGYFIGNSLTYRANQWNMQGMAWSRGHGFNYGLHIGLGTALNQLWDDPNGAFISVPPYGMFQNALTNYEWDVISLQPYSRPIEGPVGDRLAIRNFINLAKVRSPNAQFYLFEQWPVFWEGAPLNYDQRWLTPHTNEWDDTIRSRDFYEKLTRTAREDFPNLAKPVCLVPVGDVLYELNQRMHAGLVPGYADVAQLYRDVVHLDSVGEYLVSLTYYATMFKEDPRGLPYNDSLMSAELAAILQDATWKVVRDHPLAGVSGPVEHAVRPRLRVPPTTLVPEPGGVGALLCFAIAGALRRRPRCGGRA